MAGRRLTDLFIKIGMLLAMLGISAVPAAAFAVEDDDEPGPKLTAIPTTTPAAPAAEAKAPSPWSTASGGAVASSPSTRKNARPVPTSDQRVLYALGAHARMVTIPRWLFGAFLDQSTELVSGTLGLDFTRRKGQLDVVFSFDFGFYSPRDGNFLAAGSDPSLDTHYTKFDDMNLLSFDIAFVWQRDLAPWLAFTLGAGFGLGAVLGDVHIINNSQTVCNADNAGDPERCYPVSSDTYVDSQGQTRVIGAVRPSDPDFQRKLDATAEAQRRCDGSGNDCRDTAEHPHYHSAAEKPSVFPILNLQIGFRFKIHRHFNFNLTGGFRNGFIVGGGPEIVF